MSILKNKNFLYMFLGRITTNIGDSLYTVAAMWLVYDLGGSTFFTGLAGFLTLFPRLIQFLSGPLLDRISIRKLLLTTQLLQAALLLLIPLAAYAGYLTVGLVLIISPILTTLNMLVYPAQIAALPKLVNNKDLSQANSLFAVAYQGIEIACNALAGVLIVTIGAISIYLLDSVMFMLGALLFSFIRLPKQVATPKTATSIKSTLSTYKRELTEGISILFSNTFSRLLLGVLVINFVGGATFVVLPAFSEQRGGAEIFGFLLMAQAIGSLAGALLAPYLRLENIGIGRVYAIAFLISGTLWATSIFIPTTWLMIVIYGLAWFPGGVTNILINTAIQKGIPKHLLGRVFAASMSVSGIAMPLGSLIGGSTGALLGPTPIIAASGAIVLGVGIFWLIDTTTRSLPNQHDISEETFVKTPSQIRNVSS
ncbi:MFS transporter [Paenalkalicoccus suaedae]|uniref:MFS transporter n=1 Tax=Paenalkalicoccus suaedae TaxID=2592382 RepID=A0A859FJQ6_9BACI|nr:MFS transporter [Paenalkalicoccus suaedae]QKS73029.1 MFS transporter [Paenalkalicoccus suaedae]